MSEKATEPTHDETTTAQQHDNRRGFFFCTAVSFLLFEAFTSVTLSKAFTMSKSTLAAVLILCIGSCDAFFKSYSPRRLRTRLSATPPPPPPWNSKITTPSSITGRLGKSAPEYPIGEVVCVGDMLYDCIANDDAKGWPIEKVMPTNY